MRTCRIARYQIVILPMLIALFSAPAVAQPSCRDPQANGMSISNARKSSDADLVLTPVVWSVLAPLVPVLGTDGRVHLAYELQFTNVTSSPVRITSVEAVDSGSDNRIAGANRVLAIRDEDVTGKVRLFAHGGTTMTEADYSDTLGPGQGGIMYFDLTFADGQDVPCAIAHRVTGSQLENTSDGHFTAVGPVAVLSDQPAVVLGPPLRGGGWVNGSGCCEIIGPHRFTILPSNGRLRPAEHFAIDFVQIDEDGRLFDGDLKNLEDWGFYGADVLAAAPGRVVEIVDDLPDQPPGELPESATPFTAGGNRVIMDIGEGRFALYAHLIPGSVAEAGVEVGNTVEKGQLLGRVGNSGNTDGPHLHFQIMDAPSTLNADGLPFVFEDMVLEGRLTTSLDDMNEQLFAGKPAEIDRKDVGPRTMQMPLTLDVVAFPSVRDLLCRIQRSPDAFSRS